MHCPNCGAPIEDGQFCTECGMLIPDEPVANDPEEAAASPSPQDVQESNQAQQSNAKSQVTNRGNQVDLVDYYVTLFKQPDLAMKETSKTIVPGIITLVVFALLYGIENYYLAEQISMNSTSFADDFLYSFLYRGILFVVIIALTFASLKFTAQELSFQDVFVQYTGMLIPFVLLFTAGFILEIITLDTIGNPIMTVSITASRMAIPAIFILKSSRKQVDLLYLLVGLFTAIYLASTFLSKILNAIF